MAFKEVKNEVGEWWKPTVQDDEVTGVVVQEREHEEYGRSVIMRKDDGTTVGLPAHSALQNLLRDVKVGDRIKVVYAGEKMGNNKRVFRSYRVYKDE